MQKAGLAFILTAAMFLSVGDAGAAEPSRSEMRSLDEQVQEIKSDVLDIATELSLLEERLLFPSNTQFAVFVSLDGDVDIRLDAVHLLIDGEPAAHYIYSFKELEALQEGGVQRLYTGNIPRGEHALEISVIGKTPGGRDFTHSESFSFTKGIEPQLLGLNLTGPESIQLVSW